MANLDYDRIQSLIDSLNLVQNGVHCRALERLSCFENANAKYVLTKEKEEVFHELLELIPVFYEKKYTSVRTGCNSYVTKHDLEKYLKGSYVDNATTILAFAYLGFEISQYRDASPNVSIKAKLKYKSIRNDIGLQTYIRKLKNLQLPVSTVSSPK